MTLVTSEEGISGFGLYDSLREKYGSAFRGLFNGSYELRVPQGIDLIGRNPDGRTILELTFPENLSDHTVSHVSLFYEFPYPLRNPQKLIKGLQRTENVVSVLQSQGYSRDSFSFGYSYQGHVFYSLRKPVKNVKDVTKVFQELSALESIIKLPLH